jgi:hypothetical protein
MPIVVLTRLVTIQFFFQRKNNYILAQVTPETLSCIQSCGGSANFDMQADTRKRHSAFMIMCTPKENLTSWIVAMNSDSLDNVLNRRRN